ncbi:MAG: hypothetical protein J7K57_02045 [Palaeococcus sp.]|uniref:hypothetical protein n=1 Tax=Palaeococcus sp. (in: euryarchaeotes) TaxID=2820298 RepID=UPI0025F66EF1|nr:hypothetical protein [Palaeococcus sp. (in: euryarchaeotes)]MCD6558647.1 hypothetical protein [Palaeococcus sp. (in: euryarchaeotes)]
MKRWVVYLITGVVILGSLAFVSAYEPKGQKVAGYKLIRTQEFGNSSVKHMILNAIPIKEMIGIKSSGTRILEWSASTDLVRHCNFLLKCYPEPYSSSKSRWQDNGYPADIQRIGLRSRVWKKAGWDWSQIYSDQVDKYDDSDANLHWSGESHDGGEYLAKSNHWFETSSGESWYPETSDTCNC